MINGICGNEGMGIRRTKAFNYTLSPPSASLTRNLDLKILSWNIHDGRDSIEGKKSSIAEFREILEGCPVFCLQETKGEVTVPNYRCFNKLRHGSRSGGLCIGLYRGLESQPSFSVKEIPTGCEDIQAVTITYSSEGEDVDFSASRITLINIYDSPEASSFKKRRKAASNEVEATTLDLLLEFIATSNLGSIYLTGDFNARTKSLNHEPTNDDYSSNEPQKSELLDSNRSSKDAALNVRGKKLIDLLACSNITLLNGNTIGDIFGEYTSVNYSGASVVDYSAVSADLTDYVKEFRVCDLNRFSDHKPCVGSLRIPFNNQIQHEDILATLEDAPRPYTWGPDDAKVIDAKFIENQARPATELKLSELKVRKCSNEEDVIKLNNDIVETLREIADNTVPRKIRQAPKCVKNNGKDRRRMKPKSPWFDSECILGKRKLNVLARRYGKTPHCQIIREEYYCHRKSYRKLVKRKKDKFFADLTRDIESGKNITWDKLKKLKKAKGSETSLDVYDMQNFCDFFEKLYSKSSLTKDQMAKFRTATDVADPNDAKTQDELELELDNEITIEELEVCIKNLKRGKAVSEDLISNEFIKASGILAKNCIRNLFNECLRLGIYPWTTSLVTPLHKKGSVYDPNNYRAIAVASNVGKLFAGILLQRLIKFRSSKAPDSPNQLGFRKNAQTCDHVLTLTTCIRKYTGQAGGRLHTCFVDYAKAFDTVCREALLFKLWELGIKGNFFKCMNFMYSHSTAKIKLLKKVSRAITISTGTEQGHPMSPELFKCYLHALSEELNDACDPRVPVLNGKRVSHLLWADDLVLMALDGASLQILLDILLSYCLEWGLSVNISKTAVMVFSKSGRLLKESEIFTYGELRIPSVREYCYLGITFSLNGSLKRAQEKLRQKATRSYFALKRLLDLNSLKVSTVLKLFDTLILPIVTYGCQVWLTETALITNTVTNQQLQKGTLATAALDHPEKLHLSFMKWSLGVGKRTSNAAIYGDTGRVPVAVMVLKQVYSYYDRLRLMDIQNSDTLVRHAFAEQKLLQLPWYSKLTDLRQKLSNNTTHTDLYPSQLREQLKTKFIASWEDERKLNKKLSFYNKIKTSFGRENYVDINMGREETRRLAQLRASAHGYAVETGRHGTKRTSILNRLCPSCTTSEQETILIISELPFFDPIIEDEEHVLLDCPKYAEIRYKLAPGLKSAVHAKDVNTMFTCTNITRSVARYVSRCHNERFPKDDSHKEPKQPQETLPQGTPRS